MIYKSQIHNLLFTSLKRSPLNHGIYLKMQDFLASYGTSSKINKHEDSEVWLPPKVKVVICGGGVMGAAVAYHLAKLGWGPNTILVEKGRFVFIINVDLNNSHIAWSVHSGI